MSWKIIILLSKFRLVSNILSFALRHCKITPRVLLMWSLFGWCYFLRLSSSFHFNHFLTYIDKFSLIKLLWPHSQSLLNGGSVNLPMVSYFFYISLESGYIFCKSIFIWANTSTYGLRLINSCWHKTSLYWQLKVFL